MANPTFIGYIGGHVRQRSHYLIAVDRGGFLVILYLTLIVKEREMDPFDYVQFSVLNKVGPMWLIYDYLCFWSIS